MRQGYTVLMRKAWDNPKLKERGKRFSKFEAWFYLVNVMARGVDEPDGLKRGEFDASIRYLSRRWNWSKSAVERFISELLCEPDPMIMRVGQQAGQFVGHFIICKYNTYNPLRDSLWDTKRDKVKKVLKESNKSTAIAEAEMEDPLYVIFRDLHQRKFDAPYQYQTADFVHLAKLKKSLGLTNGKVPDGWDDTCRHYLDTPQGKLTLADMCVRYPIFKASALDKYNRPITPTKPIELAKPKTSVTFGKDAAGKQVAYIMQEKEK